MKQTISADVEQRLNAFTELLLRWNGTVNLISRDDENFVRQRHVDDSLQLLGLLPQPLERAIDIGSGGGFPGLVLAIATDITWDLIEADQRKASFLREAARLTKASVRVFDRRAEDVVLPRATLITARGCMRLTKLLEAARHLLAPGGVYLFHKGKGAEAEVTEAEQDWQMKVDRIPSSMSSDSTILRVREVSRGGKFTR